MKNSNVIKYAESSAEFYPTPAALVNKMLDGIDFDYIKTILEPSAGKGDILKGIARKESYRYGSRAFDVDAIEIDPNLRQILKYNFSDERKSAEREKNRNSYSLEEEFFTNGIHVVHDDFLTFDPFKTYDIIIMNPPFSKGCEHLLKALEIQKRGGSIVCLLNAETLRNPFTENRRALIRLLDQYGAQIEYIENGFSQSEHSTDVEVALVKVSIPQEREESDFYERMKKSEMIEDEPTDTTDLDVTDFIKSAVQHFRVETKAGIELIRQFRAFQPHMARSLDKNEKGYGSESILRLTSSSERGYDNVSINEYLRLTRLKYWRALLSNPKFVGRLTSKLQAEYHEKVDSLGAYDFDEFNIQVLAAEMMTHVHTGIEDEIMAMFERLTVEHMWRADFSTNRHYFDGWATNEAYKVNKKVILPCYGVYSEWGGNPRTYEAAKVLSDIERIMNFFSASPSENVNIEADCRPYFEKGITKNVPFKHFTATFYKKRHGARHIHRRAASRPLQHIRGTEEKFSTAVVW